MGTYMLKSVLLTSDMFKEFNFMEKNKNKFKSYLEEMKKDFYLNTIQLDYLNESLSHSLHRRISIKRWSILWRILKQ